MHLGNIGHASVFPQKPVDTSAFKILKVLLVRLRATRTRRLYRVRYNILFGDQVHILPVVYQNCSGLFRRKLLLHVSRIQNVTEKFSALFGL